MFVRPIYKQIASLLTETMESKASVRQTNRSLGDRVWLSITADVVESRPESVGDEFPYLVSLIRALAQGLQDHFRCVVILNRWWYQAEFRRTSPQDQDFPSGDLLLTRLDPPYKLTPSELDVLTLVAGGLSNTEISQRLFISASTTATHIEHLLAKLGVRNRTSAASVAVAQGLLRAPIPGPRSTIGSSTLASLDPDHVNTDAKTAGNRTRPRKGLLLGSAFPLSDIDGADMLNGTVLAIEAINRSGGVGGRFIDHYVVDIDPESAKSISQGIQSLAAANVDAITFAYTYAREAIPALMDLVSDTEIPFVHSMTSQIAESIVERTPSRFGNIFQLSPGDNFYGTEFIDFLVGLRDRTLWVPRQNVIVITDDFGMASHFESWRSTALTQGFSFEMIRVDTIAGWQSAAETISDAAPFAAFIACFHPERLIAFLDWFLTKPSATLLYSVWAPGTQAFSGVLTRFDGLLWASATGRYGDVIGNGFLRNFRAYYHRDEIGPGASIQYDAVQLLRRAWSSVPSAASYASVATALRDGVYRGVNGSYYLGSPAQRPLSFPAESRDASLAQAHLVYQIQNGRNEIVSPAPYANARFIPPPWINQ